MKVSEFMIQLHKRLMEERKVSETTATQYLQTLFKLNNSKPFNNLAFLRKYEAVQGEIDKYAASTQANQYAVISSVLFLYNDKSTYKAAYNHWRQKLKQAMDEKDSKDPHDMSEKQEENWISWDDILKKKESMFADLQSFISNKRITEPEYEKLLNYVILSLYTDIQPRRNQDYLDMFVVKKLGKEYDKNKNYYDMTTHKFIFNKYKTAKKYGEQVEQVPESLQKTLALLIRFHPNSKQKEFKLLVKNDGSPLNTVNSITRILNRIFGKHIGASMLRHIFLSSKYGKVVSEMEQDSKSMSHSKQIQNSYIKREMEKDSNAMSHTPETQLEYIKHE